MSNFTYLPKVTNAHKKVSRIYWSEKKGAYIYSNYGKKIGVIRCNIDLLHELEASDYSKVQKHLNKDILLEKMSITNCSIGGEYLIDVHEGVNENELPFGVFNLSTDMYEGLIIKPYLVNTNESNLIENKNLKKIVLDFFNNESINRKNKKGILLYGLPGNGKTTEIMSLFDIAQTQNIRVFMVDSQMKLSSDLRDIKELLQKDKSVFILEEVTQRAKDGVEDLLTFLDGEESWENSITIATTNYAEELPANLIDRPGRFSTFIEFKCPNEQEIVAIGQLFGFEEQEVSPLFKQKLSFDYISYILSEAKKQGLSPKVLKEQEEEKRAKLSKTFKGKIGIG